MNEAQRLLSNHDMLVKKAKEIMAKKNHDYTGGSGDPYANFRMSEAMGVHPALGLLIRVGDKMQRVRTFATRGELRVDGEGLEDAVIDVINYMVLVYSLLTEQKFDDGMSAEAWEEQMAELDREYQLDLRKRRRTNADARVYYAGEPTPKEEVTDERGQTYYVEKIREG